ncbi:shikimate dehydrogenase [Tessaracoccus caeni]|uniref:shikimate dehydrogenase n=1 Tax=Tessaracoccus caeni TaxID=3031239 RepID=UPI0023DC7AF8|nr:shikimate dehydrogenase [Tessaracoccus caeni]MDF1488555.1 shikimate dehydrogenase [Tessaracoccus caeni]
MTSPTAAPRRPYLVGLIGSGVLPSFTPPMHMAEAAALGVSYVYRPIDLDALGLTADQLPEILSWARALGYDALNITFPCKRQVVDLLDHVDPTALRLGSVNTVIFTEAGMVGYNTDTSGYERAFRAGMPGADLSDIVLLGAGGGGSGVADALLRLGAERLTIVDVDADRAAELASSLGHRRAATVDSGSPSDLPDILRDATGLVNCTPIGMHHHPGMPLDEDLLRPELWVSDIVYRPLQTRLLTVARGWGCATLDGGRMAVFQAVEAMELITGLQPDPERMRQHFLHLLAAEQRN